MKLAKYDAAVSALAACKTVDEAKDWMDRSAATAAYARMAKDKTLLVDAREVQIRAKRRLGEMLAEQKVNGGMNTGAMGIGTSAVPKRNRTPTLEEVGVSKKESASAQKIAAVPEPEFEAKLDAWRERAEQEGARVTAELEAAGEAYSDADQRAEVMADYAEMARVVASDDRLSAAMGEVAEWKAKTASVTALYERAARELETMRREAARWMKKAKKAAACQNCMTALERE